MKTKRPKWLSVDFLKMLKDTAVSHPSYQRYIKNSKRYYDYYFGESNILPVGEFEDVELADVHATARRNKIKEVVEKTNSILLKNDPEVRRWPFRPEDADLTDVMDLMFLSSWDHSMGQDVLRSILKDAQITGMSIGKVIWNHLDTERNPSGDIKILHCPMNTVLFDPEASNTLRGRDARFILHENMHQPYVIASRYGKDAGDAITRYVSGVQRMGIKTREELTKNIVSSEALSKEVRIPVEEYWLFPKLLYQTDLVSEDDDFNYDEYEHGMVVTVVNDEIVRTIPNPYFEKRTTAVLERDPMTGEPTVAKKRNQVVGHTRHPFVPMWWCRTADKDLDGTYGFYDCSGMVENMISLQININSLRRNIAINARTLANPVVAINEDALATSAKNLTWTPGQIIRIKQNFVPEQAIKIIQGREMPVFVFQMLMDDIQAIEQTAGIEPGVIGLFPSPGGGTSHTPALTVGALQESAFGPLWTYVAELSNTLLDLSILYDGLMQQKFEPGMYSYVSKDGAQRFNEFSSRHIGAHFKRRVVSGATTPLYDIERQRNIAGVVEIVNGSIMSQNPDIIRVAILHLEALKYPWANQFIQLLESIYQRIVQMQEGVEGVGLAAIAGSAIGEEEQEEPESPMTGDYSDIVEKLSAASGLSIDEVVARLG